MAAEKLRVLYVIADSSQTGGPMIVRNLALGLRESHQVGCVCPSGWLQEELENQGVRVLTLPDGEGRVALVRRLRRYFAKYETDILHFQGPRAGILGRIAALGSRSSIVYTELIWTEDYRRLIGSVRGWIQTRLLRAMDAHTDATVGLSGKVVDFLVGSRITKAERTRVIYASVPEMERAEGVADPVIGTLGSLNHMKATDVLLRALPLIRERYPRVRCRVGGEGDLIGKLQTLTEQLDVVEQVEWLGRVHDPRGFFPTLQVYVHPSRNETFGMAPVEAMAAGIPVVATAAGSLPEVVEDGRSGILIPIDDHVALADAVCRLLDDPAERARLRAGGFEQAARFSISHMVEEHRRLYMELSAADKVRR